MHDLTEPGTFNWIWDDARQDDSWRTIVYMVLAWFKQGRAHIGQIHMLAQVHPRVQGRSNVMRQVRRALCSPVFVHLGADVWGIRSQVAQASRESAKRGRYRRSDRNR